MKNLIRVSFATFFMLLPACSQSKHSKPNASNQFNGKNVKIWYETLTLDASDENSFLKFHRDNKDILLGNGVPFVSENLKGLWFMDGNPIGDKTFNFSSIKPPRNQNEDFYLEVNTPAAFSWTNIKESHEKIAIVTKIGLAYSFQYRDCPADIKLEREKTWGMADGSCTKADQEFLVIIPMVSTFFGWLKVPESIVYFDMYLRPKTDDFLVWERRSKVYSVKDAFIEKLTTIFRRDTIEKSYHRYRFTQVMDKDGNSLSSMPRLVESVASDAKASGKDVKDFLLYNCYEGELGCGPNALSQAQAPLYDESQNMTELGVIPVF